MINRATTVNFQRRLSLVLLCSLVNFLSEPWALWTSVKLFLAASIRIVWLKYPPRLSDSVGEYVRLKEYCTSAGQRLAGCLPSGDDYSNQSNRPNCQMTAYRHVLHLTFSRIWALLTCRIVHLGMPSACTITSAGPATPTFKSTSLFV